MLERYGRDAPKRRNEKDVAKGDAPSACPHESHFHTDRLNATRLAWSPAAKLFIIICVSLLCLLTAHAPHRALSLFTYSFTAVILIHSTLRWIASFTAPLPQNNASTVERSHYPPYTVLVPLYHEAHMAPSLMAALSRLDYPRDALQILVITEGNDPATGDAVAAFLPQSFDNILCEPTAFEHIIVPRDSPDCGPQTKPNALNYAMNFARGAYVTIYDAEDHPDPSQLKSALHGFDLNPQWGALQAPLDYFNTGQNWLTRQFALEYAALFHVWVPFLSRLGLPFPLGGTSNHIRRGVLGAIGGWDAYNVTEDADLSFRLAALGWRIGYITPPTREEAVGTWTQWEAQRRRWMKGYMQTWLVHMQRPFAPKNRRSMSLRRFLTLQITLGASLLAGLLHGLFLAAMVAAVLMGLNLAQSFTARPIIWGTLIFSYSSGFMMGIVGAMRRGEPKLAFSCIMMPFYWPLLLMPSWFAVVELFTRPFHWAKTTHGLTHHRPDSLLRGDRAKPK